jgi:dTDP-4-amino-4,6-dideoxygalactose transaminase
MPTFLAFIGILQLRRWNREVVERMSFLEKLKLLLAENDMSALMPEAYFNADLQIVPLRLALSFHEGKVLRAKLRALIDIDGTWFLEPLIATPEDPIRFGCDSEKLPVSIKTGRDIVNIPCNLGSAANNKILDNLAKIIGKNNEI